jgi:putative copper export protein
VLSPSLTTVRLFLHVLGATVWVGGQIVLGGLVGTLKAAGPEVPRAAARRFNRLAWPAFALLFVTGIWNLLEIDLTERSTGYQVSLGLKLLVVALSGVGAALHAGARSRVGLAAWGAVSGLSALAALWLGVQLAA